MADLSNLLGDVYGEPSSGGPAASSPAPASPQPPAWADESRLDEAFADWTPEPLEPVVAKAPSTSAPLDDDLAAALSAALAEAPRPTMPAVEHFAHVDPVEPVEPPVVDGETLERLATPVVDVAAAEGVFVPPTPVELPPAPAVVARRRSFSFRRTMKAPAAVEAGPAVAGPVAAPAPGGVWRRTDDDILPSRSRG